MVKPSEGMGKLLEEIESVLGEFGVENYILGAEDPDSDVECIRKCGSPAWQVGISEMIKFLVAKDAGCFPECKM